MQFQLTININLCFIVFLSGITLGNSPFNVIQLLWINLIMDTLGAIAICTEPFIAGRTMDGNSNRISRRDKIITVSMWRNITGQVIYQTLTILILMYFGQMMFFEKSFNLVTEKMRTDDNKPTDKMKLHTMIFHTFVLMNLFNQINCRIVNDTQLNPFRTLLNNKYFWLIFLFELGLQCYMVQVASEYMLGSALLQIAPQTRAQLIVSWTLGIGAIPFGILFKLIPQKNFFWTERVNLEEDIDDNVLLRFFSAFLEKLTHYNDRLEQRLVDLNESRMSV